MVSASSVADTQGTPASSASRAIVMSSPDGTAQAMASTPSGNDVPGCQSTISAVLPIASPTSAARAGRASAISSWSMPGSRRVDGPRVHPPHRLRRAGPWSPEIRGFEFAPPTVGRWDATLPAQPHQRTGDCGHAHHDESPTKRPHRRSIPTLILRGSSGLRLPTGAQMQCGPSATWPDTSTVLSTGNDLRGCRSGSAAA